MTDKELKEKILAEIKRRLLKIQISSVRSAEMDGAEIVLNALLSFVNSQPEELVSKDLEEAINVASEKERLHKAKNESHFFSQVDFASGFMAGVQWKEGKQ